MPHNRSMFSHAARPHRPVAAASGDIYLYDEIGPWGITAKEFIDTLNATGGKVVNIRLNSPGGDVFDGQAIYEAIRRRAEKDKVVVHIDGVAASIASVIAMAGSEIVIAKGAYMMIHEPWTITVGGASEMRKSADVLDIITDGLSVTYADRTGMGIDEIKSLLAAETWYTGEQAVEAGLADRLSGTEAVKAAFDLSVFRNAPEDINADDHDIMRDVEKILRDAGYSRKSAKAFISAGRSGRTEPETLRDAGDQQRDADKPETQTGELCAALSALEATIKG